MFSCSFLPPVLTYWNVIHYLLVSSKKNDFQKTFKISTAIENLFEAKIPRVIIQQRNNFALPKLLILLVNNFSLHLCLTLFDTMNCSLQGSAVLGILQARILELADMPSSRGSSWPRDQLGLDPLSPTLQEDSLLFLCRYC